MSWSTANQRNIVRELARVRVVLERFVATAQTAQPRTAPGVDSRLVDHSLVDHSIDDGAQNAAPDSESSFALPTIVRAFDLSPFERDILLLCAGVELDARIASLVAQARGAADGGGATFGLALAMLNGAHWSALTPSAPLRAWRLIDLNGAGVTNATLRIDERVLHHLAGVDHVDERLHGLVEIQRALSTARTPSLVTHEALATSIAERLGRARAADGRIMHAQITGADANTRLAVAESVGALLQSPVLRMRANDIPQGSVERVALATLLSREAILSHALVTVDTRDDADDHRMAQFLTTLRVPALVLAPDARRTLRDQTVSYAIAPSTRTERLTMWQQALGPRAASLNGALSRVTAQFDLDHAAIQSIASSLPMSHARAAEIDASVLWDECRLATRPKMEGLAQRIEAIAGWDDLVLPEPQRRVMRTIAAHVRMRHRVYEEWGFAEKSARGLGIAVLFAGASGTGKTMAAEVLARELRLDLYRIDLASVVSKYIGETEKNLKRLFDTAEGGGAILLFDEADALFGKRTEVKDSHDRYANIETSYLLQRMESYRGLAILTTNMRNALDPAFLRRLRFIVNFPFPDAVHRAAIWRGAFPAGVPIHDIDWDRLAQLNVAGGQIRNIALSAAFLAADRDEHVAMRHLADAAHAEYAKVERAPSDAEMRGWT